MLYLKTAVMMLTITIPNWEKLQHYKDRNPPWIKLRRSLIEDPDNFVRWSETSSDAAKLLVELWLLASMTLDGCLQYASKTLAFKLHRGEEIDKLLQELHVRGWIILDDSVLLAECLQPAIPETETEGEKRREEKTTSSSSSRDDTAFVESVKSFWNENNLKPSVRLISDRRRSSILARRRQYGEGEVRTVLNKRRDSSFLSFVFNDGRGADIDWVTNPNNFMKIADGKYDDNDSKSQLEDESKAELMKAAKKTGYSYEECERFQNAKGGPPIDREEMDEFMGVPF